MAWRIVDVRRGEGRAVAWSFGLSFCLLGSQYLLRPVRDAMGLTGQVKDLPRLFLWTLLGTLLATPLVALLATRLPRRAFLATFLRGAAVSLVAFWFALRGPSVGPAAARAFFVWTSVVNLFVVSVGWGFLADTFRREQGARVFGLVAGGGTLGAIAGSFVAAASAERVGAPTLLLAAAALLEGGVACMGRVIALRGESAAVERPLRGGGVARWVIDLARNPYLLGIVLYMLLFTTTSTFVYLDQARIVKAAIATTAARTALFARMDLAVNVASFGLQALVASALLRRLGAARTLVILPLASLAGFVALRAAPTLGVLVAFQVARRALDYGIAKPAREVLFTVVTPEEKYKAKSFIDTFVYRGGDAASAWAFEVLAPWLGVGLLAASAPLCACWAAIAWSLGRASTRR